MTTAIDDARTSAPPMSPIPPAPTPPRRPTGSHAPVGGDESTAERALRIACEARDTARDVAELVGSLPTVLAPGRGFVAVVLDQLAALNGKIDGAATRADEAAAKGTAAIELLRAELQHDREAADARDKARAAAEAAAITEAERKRAPWARIGWHVLLVALGAITLAAIGGVGAYVATHVRWTSPPAQLP